MDELTDDQLAKIPDMIRCSGYYCMDVRPLGLCAEIRILPS